MVLPLQLSESYVPEHVKKRQKIVLSERNRKSKIVAQ